MRGQMASQPSVGVIIVTAGNPAYLNPCLDSLRNQTFKSFAVTIIDNSADNTLQEKINISGLDAGIYAGNQKLYYCRLFTTLL